MRLFLIFGIAIMICTSFEGAKSIDIAKLSFTASIERREKNGLLIRTILTNNSSDTIKYISVTCPTQSLYRINSNYWKMDIEICYKTSWKIIAIAPHKSISKELNLTRHAGFQKSENLGFAVGFYYLPYTELKNIPPRPFKFENKDKIVWSNYVEPIL